MKLKEIKGLMLENSYLFPERTDYDLRYNQAIDEQGEREIELDEDKILLLIKLYHDCCGGDYCDSYSKYETQEDFAKAICSALPEIIKVKE